MRSRSFRALFLCLPALLTAVPAVRAQAPAADSLQEIRLVDGSVLYGRVLDEGPPVSVRLAGGEVLEVDSARIRSVRAAPGSIRGGEYWPPDPNQTRLFFGPTGRTPPARSGYLALYEVFIPFVSFSPTDRLIISGGTPFVGGFGGDRPYWLAPKLRVLSSGPIDVSVGALAIRWDDENAGILYGVATRGSGDAALTLALGYGYEGGDLADSPAAMVGGEARVSRSVKLLAEGYVFDGEVLGMGGMRFFGERLSADLGILLAEGAEGFLPVVNFVYAW